MSSPLKKGNYYFLYFYLKIALFHESGKKIMCNERVKTGEFYCKVHFVGIKYDNNMVKNKCTSNGKRNSL